MITVVVTNRGTIKGYIIDSIYIKKDLLKYFSPVKILRGIRVIGSPCGEDIKVRGKRYKSVLKYMNLSGYEEVIRSFTLNGIELNDVLFVLISVKDVHNVTSDVWKIISDWKNVYFKCVMAVDNSGETLAYMLTSSNLYHSAICYINMVEVIERRSGNGRRIINQLLNINCVVRGLALVSSVDFWKKMGAVFVGNDYHFSLRKGGSNLEVV